MFTLTLRFAMILTFILVAATVPGVSIRAQGQPRVFLPLTMTTPLSPLPPPPPPPSDAVSVKSSRSFLEPGSNFRVIAGEVVNTRSSSVGVVTITARFYNRANELVDTQMGYGFLPITKPGEGTPFRVITSVAAAMDIRGRYELSVDYEQPSPEIVDLQILAHQIVDIPERGQKIIVDVKNHNPQRVVAILVAATIYDENGNVVNTLPSVDGAYGLPPEATERYHLPYFDATNIASYSVAAMGTLKR